jgi:hypothetical protein
MATPIISHGSVAVDYPDRRIRSRRDDLNEVTQTFQRATTNAFDVGQTFPGLTDYVISEINRTDEVPGNHVYELKGIGGLGIIGLKEVQRQEQVAEEGFDSVVIRYISTTPRPITLGQFADGVAACACVEVQSEQHPGSPNFWNVTATYRGIIGPKEVKIRWANAAREISKDQLSVPGPGGWETPQKSEILWGRQEATLSFVTDTLPETFIPRQSAGTPHPSFPEVQFVPFTTSEPTFHWPNGWTRTGVNCDVISGTTVAFVTEQWLFNPRVTL